MYNLQKIGDKFFTVDWILGLRCNYDCSFCSPIHHNNHAPHRAFNEIKIAIDRIKTMGDNINIVLLGGEPTVHPNISDILKELDHPKFKFKTICTNGTRKLNWFEDHSKYINHITFSLHFEYDWKRVLDTIIKYNEYPKHSNFSVNVMAHHLHMDDVKNVVKLFDEKKISYSLRRIRWPVFKDNKRLGHEEDFDDVSVYTKENLKWILNKDSTTKLEIMIDDIEPWTTNDIIKNNMNSFKGWECSSGINNIMIDENGEVFRSYCLNGGSLGNIYENDIVLPSTPIICNKNFCTVTSDIKIDKKK
jgi:hypothetical protein